LTSVLTVSEQAVAQDGTRVGYRAGEHVAVQDALQGMLAISGNDAAWALAQHAGGGDANAFIARMNAVSKALNLNRSQWQNPHGLTQDGHVSTAADLAALAHALWRDYPVARPWLGVKTYTWNAVTQSNRNSLLWRDATVDGLKTGHTDAAGYNLAATSNWRVTVDSDDYDWRLTSVVLATASTAARATDSAALLAWGRSAFMPWRLYRAGDNVGLVRVTGAVGVHAATAPATVWLVLPAGTATNSLRYELIPAAPVTAPVAAGAVIARLNIYSGDQLLLSTPAMTTQAIARAPWYARAWAWVKSWFA
jgi:D-alanyl-D-alanine carboxypeptidase (penicillin-binding protein 5/6)